MPSSGTCSTRDPTSFDLIRLSAADDGYIYSDLRLVYLDDLLAGDDEAFEQRGVGQWVTDLTDRCLPPLLVLRKVTRILEDYVVVANISDLKNRRAIEIVLRRQKTVAAFEALKGGPVFARSEDAFKGSRPPVDRLAPIYLVR